MKLNAQAQLCLDVLFTQGFLPVKVLCTIVAEYANAFEGRPWAPTSSFTIENFFF